MRFAFIDEFYKHMSNILQIMGLETEQHAYTSDTAICPDKFMTEVQGIALQTI